MTAGSGRSTKYIRNEKAHAKKMAKEAQERAKRLASIRTNLLRIIGESDGNAIGANNTIQLIEQLIQLGVLGALSNTARKVARTQKRSPLSSQQTRQDVERMLLRDGQWFAQVDETLTCMQQEGLIEIRVDDHGAITISANQLDMIVNPKVKDLPPEVAVVFEDMYHPDSCLTGHLQVKMGDDILSYR